MSQKPRVFLATKASPYLKKGGRIFLIAADGRTVLSAPLRLHGEGETASHYYEASELEESTADVDDLGSDEVEAIRLLLAPPRSPSYWYALPVEFDEPNGTARLGEIPVIVSPDGKGLVDLLTGELIGMDAIAPDDQLEGHGKPLDGPAYKVGCARWTGRVPKARYDQILSGEGGGAREIVAA